MNRVTPRIPSGFMELLPADQIEFNRMIEIIRTNFELFGYAPIDTPTIELAEVLLAQDVGETGKQVYRFNKGDTDLALRFDMTVPLARYVAQHQNDLVFPYRRYAIGKVWRGERAQRGRFREFYQCDIDVIGSNSTLIDAEIPSVIYKVFTALGFSKFTIRINNRRVLNGFLESRGLLEKSEQILRTIDKLDKKGREFVENTLHLDVPMEINDVDALLDMTTLSGNPRDVVASLEAMKIDNPTFVRGLDELLTLSDAITNFGVPQQNFKFDLSIARGLAYYTGTVYETRLDDYPQIGSVCGGGRYDDLTKYYSDRDLPGVGISIGLTRLFYQLKEAGLIKNRSATTAEILLVMSGSAEGGYAVNRSVAIQTATELRNVGIRTELVLHEDDLKKQLKYADKLGVPCVLIFEAGSDALPVLKNMRTGELRKISSFDELVATIKDEA